MKKIYITTPIYYINAAPHIGHAYTTIAADVLARFHRSQNREIHFLTGTDEHGLKIEEAARALNLAPKDYADKISEKFRELWKHLDIRYDDFIRTIEERHIRCVENVFGRLLKSGDIYKGFYEGYYCLSCETYWTEKEILPNEKNLKLCPNAECKKPLERVKEETYFFKLSKYQDALLSHYQKNPDFLSPSHRALEIVNFVKSGLQDISVSRAKVKWGIAVPGDSSQTVYVWFDALLNYVSAVLDGQTQNPSADFWPADVHIVGKEIYRFHTVIWPAMLLALNLPLPKKVFAHGWWTVEGQKMSKSKGNFVDPYEMTREFGVDAFRYFLLREMPFGQDGDFSIEALRRRYNSDLANDLGNLISRVVEMTDRFLGGKLPSQSDPEKHEYPKRWAEKTPAIHAAMENLNFSEALSIIWSVISSLNQYVNEQAPWKLQKTSPEKVEPVLFNLVWSIRIVMGWLEPFMPQTAAKVQAQIGIRRLPRMVTAEEVLSGKLEAALEIHKAPPLFPRKIKA